MIEVKVPLTPEQVYFTFAVNLGKALTVWAKDHPDADKEVIPCIGAIPGRMRISPWELVQQVKNQTPFGQGYTASYFLAAEELGDDKGEKILKDITNWWIEERKMDKRVQRPDYPF